MATFDGITRPNPALRLSGLAEPVEQVRPDDGRAYVAIDTGYGVHRIDGNVWQDEFELADDGTFELLMWDGKARRAHLVGRIIDGNNACSLLERMNMADPDLDCSEQPAYERGILSIEYVRVQPEYRGRRYAVQLLRAAIDYFGPGKLYAYADVYSQAIYNSFRAVLPTPAYAIYTENMTETSDEFDPSDESVRDNLDPLPTEGKAAYRGGFKLANKKHAQLLWHL